MLHENGHCATCATQPVTADEIVKGIIGFDKPSELKKDLREALDAFLLQDEDLEHLYKVRVYSTFMAIFNALDQIEIYQNQAQ